ncbi:transcriptional regulator [Thermanaerovibrio velox DSM 12556]|uniref:Transcriptional regulator n=1 Tax=Thermanaerovibrio velox DSM 12556 TaxID=926567 RepID=H0UPW0_9BACT|nr:GntR family transcriptional regulator [Thermanaerovibrio velox]EHM10669.1 transcriptional regulator [Thermanaerovibrio velox DSM 12556]
MTLRKESPVPLYYQLKEKLLRKIEQGELKPGDPIPSERELCDRYKISRMTAAKAVTALVNEGVLFRQRGVGTFVAHPKPPCSSSTLGGFTDNIREAGLSCRTEIISFSEEPAEGSMPSRLQIPDGALVFSILRLRFVEDEPFSLEHAWIPKDRFPDLTPDLLNGDSLYRLFREHLKKPPVLARQTIEAVLASEYEAKMLQEEPKTPMLLFRRVALDSEGLPLEFSKCIYRGRKFLYEITFSI